MERLAKLPGGLPFLVAVILLGTSHANCRRPEPTEPAGGATVAQYSPFEVLVEGDLPYDVISFKDVGLGLPHSEQAYAYEAIAESLSLEISAVLTVDAQSRFSPSRADPAHHQSCESRRVYVDLWRPGGHGWGYSLWSGCGEDDNFAWEDLPKADASKVGELTHSIAVSLAHATRTSCFARTC